MNSKPQNTHKKMETFIFKINQMKLIVNFRRYKTYVDGVMDSSKGVPYLCCTCPTHNKHARIGFRKNQKSHIQDVLLLENFQKLCGRALKPCVSNTYIKRSININDISFVTGEQ